MHNCIESDHKTELQLFHSNERIAKKFNRKAYEPIWYSTTMKSVLRNEVNLKWFIVLLKIHYSFTLTAIDE